MGAAEAIEPTTDRSAPAVELRVDAAASQLGVVRAIAGTIAAQADFDLDTIADIRLAVDEAASYLVVRARPGSQLHCTFRSGDGELVVAVSAATESDDLSLRHSFGWHVLNTLTDTVELRLDPDAEQPGASRTVIEFSKYRDAAS